MSTATHPPKEPEITEAQALMLADEIFNCVKSLDGLKRLAARANSRYEAIRKAQKRQRKLEKPQ